MLKRFASLTLAAALVGTLGACAPEREIEGGGAGTVAEQQTEGRTPAEQAAAQDALAWGTTLTGDKRTMAEAVARTGWMQANLAAHEWEQAGEDLADIEDMLIRLSDDPDVPAAVQQQLATVDPMIKELGAQLLNRDQASVQTAHELSSKMAGLLTDQQVMAWMGEDAPVGGGAGEGVIDRENRGMEDQNEGVME